jgi:hypothetical protein
VDVDRDAVAGALDVDVRHAGVPDPLADVAADAVVLDDVVGVLLVGEPTRLVVGDHAEPEAVRVDFLAHG